MSRQRLLGQATRSVAAVSALLIVVGGIPALLIATVGWPLPRALPHLSDVASALGGQSIDDGFLVKALAVICWVAWTQFIACIAAEILAWRSGRAPRVVPFAGTLQPLVAQLVVTAALLAHLTPRPLVPTAVLSAATPIVHVHEPASLTSTASAQPAVEAESELASSVPTYIVKPRDDLWSLAERHLGDGLRWRELFDLNRDRPQVHGGALRHSNLVRPGWTLRFPSDAVGLTPENAPTTEANALVVSTPDPPAAATVVPPPPLAEAAPLLPACPTPPPVTVPATTTTPAAPAPAPSGGETGVAEAAPPSSPPPTEGPSATKDPAGPRTRVGVLGAGLTAAGLVVTLDRLRRAQQRRRPRDRAVRMPPADVAPTEVAIRRAATASPAGRLDLALRAFARCAAQRRTTDSPSVSAIQVGPDGIEILLNQPMAAEPGPFTIGASGQDWTLPPNVTDSELEECSADVGSPLPALVSIGKHGDSAVLIDLEATGSTALVGDDATAAAAFRALALELATSVWADTLDVVLVAPDVAAYEPLERIRITGSLSEVLAEVEASAGAMSDALRAASAAATLAARLGLSAADGWVPTVVLCERPDAEPEAFARLVALAGGGARGLAVVALGDVPDAGRILRYDDGNVDVTPPGVRLTVTGPTAKQVSDIEEILTAASDCSGVESADGATQAEGVSTAATDRLMVNAPFTDPDFDVLVRLLGPVDIEGAKQPIDRRKAVELVVYLATHAKGVDDERLKTALWPDERAPQSSFNTTVTRARSRLGTAPDGSHHLPHVVATGGIYRVGARVTTDLTLLEGHLVAARAAAPEPAIRILRAGLELVRGAPLAGTRQGYEWAYAEGLVARIETLVGEAAHQLAQLALETRDPDLAQWAACQGLLASPGDEVLFRDRMLACDLAGNPAGVEAVMDELVAAAEALEPYDTLHPETVALYERLSHRRRRTG